MDNAEHPVYTVLQEKIELVNNELLTEQMSDTEHKSLLLWKDLLEYTNVVLNSKRFPNVPKSFLNDLHNSLSALNSHIVRNYPGHSMYYSNVLNQTKRIPIVEYKGDIKQSFANMVSQFERQTVKTIEEFKKKQEKITIAWEQEKSKMQQTIQTLQKDKDIISSELNSLKKELNTQKRLNQEVILELQKKFNTFTEEEQSKITELKEGFSVDLKKFNLEYESKVKDTLQHLQKRKDEIEKLWGIIGKSSVSGQAQSYATRACNLAHLMMILALLIMGGACWGIYTITKSIVANYTTIQPGILLFRLLAAAILFVPAFYCMNVAKRQRDREFQLRDFEVKTAALEPFMERMKLGTEAQKEKDKMKIELTQTFFDKEFARENKQHGDILLSGDMLKGLEKIGNIFNRKDSDKN